MSVESLEGAVFVSELASSAIPTELLAIKRAAVLRLVESLDLELLLSQLVDFGKFLLTMCEVAIDPIETNTIGIQIRAHISLLLIVPFDYNIRVNVFSPNFFEHGDIFLVCLHMYVS